jgi:acyl dehydratase
MSFDLSAVGTSSQPQPIAWSSKDCLLYALGLGAGPDDLAYTTENSHGIPQQALPTMPVILGVDFSVLSNLGTIDWTRLVHAEQGIELFRPFSVEGCATATTRLTDVWDKGKAAVIVTETTAVDDASQKPIFTTRSAVFIKGAGGFGGPRGPERPPARELGEPMASVTYPTTHSQPLLYRLSGDRNPLHSDPWFARKAGFDGPILHGLCTYGMTGRALISTVAKGDPTQLRSMHARFASPVMPGDTLHMEIWHDSPAEVRFRTHLNDGTVVLSDGYARLTADAPA